MPQILPRRRDVAPEQDAQILALYKLHVHRPGVAQDHDEGGYPVLAAVVLVLEHPEINLCLLARSGFKAHGGQEFPGRPEGFEEVFENAFPTRVTLCPDLDEQPIRVEDPLGHAGAQVVLERV